jgi:hypothetical protein
MRILGGQQQASGLVADCQCVWCWLPDDQHKADLMLLDARICFQLLWLRIVSELRTELSKLTQQVAFVCVWSHKKAV